MAVDAARLDAFIGKALGDIGAAMSAVLISIGDELGFYRALARGRLTPTELAEQTGTHERYVREWLNNQAAAGYVEYEAPSGRYFLGEEQALCLADPAGPIDVPGAYEVVQDLFHVRQRALENFRSGAGMEWSEHQPCLFHGTERFFRTSYNAHLIGAWLPALEGVVEKLGRGGRVADVGCGHGASTILMAQAFPRSECVGYDYHEGSIATARQRAAAAGARNARFEVADASSFPGRDFDLIAFFDSLHDMADPVAAAAHARQALAPGGTCMIVEPMAGDRPQDNHNPVGRVYYGASTLICVPVSLAKRGPALGAQAGEARLREVLIDGAGFGRVRRATETPFNMVLEARA